MAEAAEQAGLKNEKVGQVVSTKMAEDHRGGSQPPRAAPALQAHRRASARSSTRTTKKARRRLGDVVRIVECRPLSKLKRWRLAEVVRRAPQVGAQPQELDVKA